MLRELLQGSESPAPALLTSLPRLTSLVETLWPLPAADIVCQVFCSFWVFFFFLTPCSLPIQCMLPTFSAAFLVFCDSVSAPCFFGISRYPCSYLSLHLPDSLLCWGHSSSFICTSPFPGRQDTGTVEVGLESRGGTRTPPDCSKDMLQPTNLGTGEWGPVLLSGGVPPLLSPLAWPFQDHFPFSFPASS